VVGYPGDGTFRGMARLPLRVSAPPCQACLAEYVIYQ